MRQLHKNTTKRHILDHLMQLRSDTI